MEPAQDAPALDHLAQSVYLRPFLWETEGSVRDTAAEILSNPETWVIIGWRTAAKFGTNSVALLHHARGQSFGRAVGQLAAALAQGGGFADSVDHAVLFFTTPTPQDGKSNSQSLESTTLLNLVAMPICVADFALAPSVASFTTMLRKRVQDLYSEQIRAAHANPLLQLMDNRLVFENVLSFLSKHDLHHFLRVLPLNIRQKILLDYPTFFSNAPMDRKHWHWFADRWLDLLDAQTWVVEYWGQKLKRSEALDIWHAVSPNLRRHLMSAIGLSPVLTELAHRLPEIDWTRMSEHLEVLDEIRLLWAETGVLPQNNNNNNNDDDNDAIQEQIQQVIQSTVALLWPCLTPTEKLRIWSNEEPEIGQFLAGAVPHGEFEAVFEKASSMDSFKISKKLWPFMSHSSRKEFLRRILPAIKPEWSIVVGEDADVPGPIFQDLLQMDKFSYDSLCQRIWAHNDGPARASLVAMLLRKQVADFDNWITESSSAPIKELFFVAYAKLPPACLEGIATIGLSWKEVKDRPLDSVWPFLDIEDRLSAFASQCFVDEDLFRYSQILMRAFKGIVPICGYAAMRTHSYKYFFVYIWPHLDAVARRAAYILWGQDALLESSQIAETCPVHAYMEAVQLDEVEKSLWKHIPAEQRLEWLNSVLAHDGAPEILNSLNSAEAALVTGIDEPRLTLVGEVLWPSLNHVKRDYFVRRCGMYSSQFREEYRNLAQDDVIHLLASTSPYAQYMVYTAWENLSAPARYSLLCAVWSEGPLAELFAIDKSTGLNSIPPLVIERLRTLVATAKRAPIYYENVLNTVWKAGEGLLDFRCRFLKMVWNLPFLTSDDAAELGQVMLQAHSPFLRHIGPELCKVLPPNHIASVILAREADNAGVCESLAPLFWTDPKTREHVRPEAAPILQKKGYCRASDLIKEWWQQLPAGDPLRLDLFAAAEVGLDIAFLKSLPAETIQCITNLERLPQKTADYRPWFKQLPTGRKFEWLERNVDFLLIMLATAEKKFSTGWTIDQIIENADAPLAAEIILTVLRHSNFSRTELLGVLKLYSDESPTSSDDLFSEFLVKCSNEQLEVILTTSPALENFTQEFWDTLSPEQRIQGLFIEVYQEFPFQKRTAAEWMQAMPDNIATALGMLAKSKKLPSPAQTADHMWLVMNPDQRVLFMSFVLQHERYYCDTPTERFCQSIMSCETFKQALDSVDDPRQLRWSLVYDTIIRDKPVVPLDPVVVDNL